ncbi:MAG: hypothetical protein CBC29_06765 [Methylococcaceae bacterium TMED69]|nr:MAG: hypothetical protein CBC29_06765 [Methylococcaceae bacterium TMED69]|tara:strand:+ start:883 stop:2256 length:1374 start_codon:yes stop_codon:yes gene_type:complete
MNFKNKYNLKKLLFEKKITEEEDLQIYQASLEKASKDDALAISDLPGSGKLASVDVPIVWSDLADGGVQSIAFESVSLSFKGDKSGKKYNLPSIIDRGAKNAEYITAFACGSQVQGDAVPFDLGMPATTQDLRWEIKDMIGGDPELSDGKSASSARLGTSGYTLTLKNTSKVKPILEQIIKSLQLIIEKGEGKKVKTDEGETDLKKEAEKVLKMFTDRSSIEFGEELERDGKKVSVSRFGSESAKYKKDYQKSQRLFDPQEDAAKLKKGGSYSVIGAINSGEISAGMINLFKEAVLRFSSLLFNAGLYCGDPRNTVTIQIPDPENSGQTKPLEITETAFGELVASLGDSKNLDEAIGSVLGCQVSRILSNPVFTGNYGDVAEEISSLLSVDPATADPEMPITFMKEYVAKSNLEGFIFVTGNTCFVVPKKEFEKEILEGRLSLPGITQGSRKILYRP